VSNDSTICAGIDIGDRYCQIAVLDEDGEMSEQTRIRTTPKAFERYFKGKAPLRVAMEVGTHSCPFCLFRPPYNTCTYSDSNNI
jgi:predicted NBD/HSP70 family sugar kinase